MTHELGIKTLNLALVESHMQRVYIFTPYGVYFY